MADHAVEYVAPSTSVPPVLRVRTANGDIYKTAFISGIVIDGLQWKDILARTRPITMPGAEKTMIFRRPMISMYFKANKVKRKLVPETMRPTAVGWLKPISLNNVAL